MRISCQTRHIICFVINLIIYLIINRNIYIYIYRYIDILIYCYLYMRNVIISARKHQDLMREWIHEQAFCLETATGPNCIEFFRR